jgi:inner membrane protein
MDRHGHYGLALLLSAPIVAVIGLTTTSVATGIPFGAVAVGTSMLPDIDLHIPGVRHRGPTHTVGFGIVASVVVGIIALGVVTVFYDLASLEYLSAFAYAFSASLVGIASHLLGDALTIGSGRYGVRPWWPFSNRVLRFGVTRSNSFVWNNGLLGVGIAVYVSMFTLLN